MGDGHRTSEAACHTITLQEPMDTNLPLAHSTTKSPNFPLRPLTNKSKQNSIGKRPSTLLKAGETQQLFLLNLLVHTTTTVATW